MKIRPRTYPLVLLSFFLLMLSISSPAGGASPASNPVRATLGQAVFPLNGPWKFHTGDNPRWADPSLDDSSWETVDLTPSSPDARDSDVGLTGYVAGWQVKGHRGYFGYAWYRIRVPLDAPPGAALALCGPFYVDSAYQVFVDGHLIGGSGDFSRQTPVAYSAHYPKLYPLPQSALASLQDRGSALIAVRAWMGPWALRYPDSGGIHIAPALGTLAGAESVYHREWRQMFLGYIVDFAEALLFLLLALMAGTLIPFGRSDPAYFWLVAALVLTACARGNQAVFFWWQFETIHGFELATIVSFVPLSIAAWTLAWCYWFRLRERAWMPQAVGLLTLLYVIPQFLLRSWFYGVFPHWLNAAAIFCVSSVRWLFFLLTLFIMFRVVSRPDREKWLDLPALLLVSVGLFTLELVKLHVPGIWFPFGVGLSLSESAYAFFDVAMFIMLLGRLYTFLPQPALAPSA